MRCQIYPAISGKSFWHKVVNVKKGKSKNHTESAPGHIIDGTHNKTERSLRHISKLSAEIVSLALIQPSTLPFEGRFLGPI
jgi:hypothetical protein